MKLTARQEAIRLEYKENTENIGMREDNLQYVFTPYWVREKNSDKWELKICECMINELQNYVDLTEKKILVLNLEFAIVLIEQGVLPENITFLTDCIEKVEYAEFLGVNVMHENLKEIIDGKRDLGQFNIVIGNPPYNNNTGNRGRGNILWDKFVELILDELLVDNGYLCFVHPSLWRKPNHNLWQYFIDNNLIYLEIHNENDGRKTFGASTRYDWYVLQKAKYNGQTTIIDEQSNVLNVNITKWEWLPNSMYDLIEKLLAKNNEETCVVIKSESAYECRKTWMNDNKTEKYKYPCVYSVNRQNEVTLKWSSKNTNGHFGIPKVIFGSGATGFYVDEDGEYGLTQWATGIVNEPQNLPKIAQVLDTPKFKELIQAMSMSKAEINPDVLSLFKKDFWKEFIDEEE
jgi:hypothetical protein